MRTRTALAFPLLLPFVAAALACGSSADGVTAPGADGGNAADDGSVFEDGAPGADAGTDSNPDLDPGAPAPISDGAPDAFDATSAGPTPVSALMVRDGIPQTTKESFMTSAVMELNWADLQPRPGQTFDWTTLDQQLTSLEAAGITNVKLRIFSGGSAPAWVKRLGSQSGYFDSADGGIARECGPGDGGDSWGGVAVQNIQGPTACVPFFWTAEYQSAYDALMHAVAARLAQTMYRAVTTVVDSSCMAVYAEVFYRGQRDGATNLTLANAGLTPDLDWACQAAAVATHVSAFGTTWRTALAINDWDLVSQSPQSDGSYALHVWNGAPQGVRGTYEFVEQVARPMLGTLLEVQNNGLSKNSSCASGGLPTTSFDCYLAQYPARHGFQTATYVATPLSASGASETLLEYLDNGLALKAQLIELPGGLTAADWKLMPCYNAVLLADAGTSAACPH